MFCEELQIKKERSDYVEHINKTSETESDQTNE